MTPPTNRPNDRGSSEGRRYDPSAELIGTTLGHFRLLEILGRGGQGLVFRARDLDLQREVAVKVLPAGQVMSATARLRFEREAEATGRIDHPAIARIYEFGESEGLLYIAMELVRGRTLADQIRAASTRGGTDGGSSELFFGFDESSDDHPSDEEVRPHETTSATATADLAALRASARYVEQTALALHAAHEAGLIHRDIKPGNLMIREDGSPCILDFGLARDDTSTAGLTRTGDLMGTPAYMSPEQVQAGRQKLDHRTDVYSLGVCLFEACTSSRPFGGDSQRELYRAILEREPAPPRKINPRIPRDLEAVIRTAMAKDADHRYATALEFAEDLGRFLRHEPVQARPAGPLLRSLRWLRRNPRVAVSAGIIVAALTATSVVFASRREHARLASDEARRSSELARTETRQKTEAIAQRETALATLREEEKARSAALDLKTKALARESAAVEALESAIAEVRDQKAEKEIALREKVRAEGEYDRLADIKRIEAARRTAALLAPPGPAVVDALEAWQREYAPIVDRLEGHETFLAELRARALPYTDEERALDHPVMWSALQQARELKRQAEGRLADPRVSEARKKSLDDLIERMGQRLATATARCDERLTWTFPTPKLRFQHETMSRLVTEVRDFAAPGTGLRDLMAMRLERSRRMRTATLEDAAAAWAACIARIRANSAYSGLELTPQLGLVPLGPDPDSGLEEFLHWATHAGPVPERSADHPRIAMQPGRGVVLVLVPGGSFVMGAQSEDPSAPHHDPLAQPDEGPPNEVTLRPYFLSKFEMTRDQWVRYFGTDPSQFATVPPAGSKMEPLTVLHPVEALSWQDVDDTLKLTGLRMPTEAEWERAAKGRDGGFWAGTSEISELHRYANLCGRETSAQRFGTLDPDHEDAYVIHTEVGRLLPNSFGLHDMTGNVAECCADGRASYETDVDPDGLRGTSFMSSQLIYRGGSFFTNGADSRLTARSSDAREVRVGMRGIRPALGLQSP
ncbi:MAG: SUMF1/EgtB/PvdO family nonheme iron enzyme [Planctomycetota bacterium]